jgi:hypothetical protein
VTTYYADYSRPDDTGAGTSWATAKKTLKAATDLITVDGDVVLVASTHNEPLSAQLNLIFAKNGSVISANTSTSLPEAGAFVGSQATNQVIVLATTLAAQVRAFLYGVTFQNGTNTTLVRNLNLSLATNMQVELEDCILILNGASTSLITLGPSGNASNLSHVRTRNCTFKFSNASQSVTPNTCRSEHINLTIDPAGVAPSVFMKTTESCGNRHTFDGCDLSLVTGTLFNAAVGASSAGPEFILRNCKVNASATLHAAGPTTVNSASGFLEAFNCYAGDVHYGYFHQNAYGKTEVVVDYVANDGAQTAGVAVSYKITTTAAASFYWPYVGPWIASKEPNTGASRIASIEGLLVNDAVVLQDDEVWGEFSYQGVSGVPQSAIINDRMELLGTPADQTSSKTYSDWTGSPTATDSGDSTFKVASASFTPQEKGFVAARVILGKPSTTIRFDPQVRAA